MEEDIYSKSYIPGTFTKHKFNTLGTHTAVKESRHRFMTSEQQKQGKHINHSVKSRCIGGFSEYFYRSVVEYLACNKRILYVHIIFGYTAVFARISLFSEINL